MRRRAWLVVLLGMVPGPASGQDPRQTFEVLPERSRATVGDTVTLRFRVRLSERDLLIDTVPRPLVAFNGVRVLSVDKMKRSSDRIFHGQARIVFYRPGRQLVPGFGLPFMRIVEGVQRATLSSDSAWVEIVPVLPPGNPSLKDIREFTPEAGPPWVLLAAGALVLTALVQTLRRRRRQAAPAAVAPEVEQEVPVPAADPYTFALQAFEQIEREHWPTHGQVARHYQAVVDVLRDYLEAAESVPARELTTGELLWALPPHLTQDGLRERLNELLDEADLVKFARLRPDAPAARRFLEQSRSFLMHWHHARPVDEPENALR